MHVRLPNTAEREYMPFLSYAIYRSLNNFLTSSKPFLSTLRCSLLTKRINQWLTLAGDLEHTQAAKTPLTPHNERARFPASRVGRSRFARTVAPECTLAVASSRFAPGKVACGPHRRHCTDATSGQRFFLASEGLGRGEAILCPHHAPSLFPS